MTKQTETINTVHHIELAEGRCYFIPKAQQKNGRYAGLQFDQGAVGRSARKPSKASTDLRYTWKVTPEGEIPEHVKAHLIQR